MVSSLLRLLAPRYQPSQLRHVQLVLLMLASPVVAFGQSYIISNGASNTCVGAFLDSGGEGASGYGNNENYTYTLCPDAPGGAISLSFLTFNLSAAGVAPVDAMTIYDGNSTAAPVLGTWTGTSLEGQVVSASAGNTTGCLTVVFRSNNTGTGVFAAAITCYQPCSRPTAAATHGSANPQKICPGESVTFNSSASTAAAGFNIANRRWDFGDGTVLNNAPVSVNHIYTQPGSYTAQLYLLDNNGCASTNRVDLVTWVGTIPDFNGTEGITGCSGETLCLDGIVNPTTWNELPDGDLGGGVFLPDNAGACFSTTLTFSQFALGQTLTNVNQLLGICVNMEHSYMGDLIIRIISPTGQTVVLHQQGGAGTYLGIPVDNELTPNVQGVCWNYCWSPTATSGTWAANSGGTLPSGTYQSVGALSGLIGSQLNGTWTFEVCDMWSIDNGFICDWGITFDPALYPDLVEFTPAYDAASSSTSWSGPNIATTSANGNQICVSGLAVGDHPYVYTVTDDFGCTYDTTVIVTIVPDLLASAGADVSTCGTPVQLNATLGTGGIPIVCDYTLWLYDSWGDGWTGQSYLTVTVDGVSTSWTLTGGSAGSTPITVSPGSTIVLNYQGIGLFAYEQSFALINSAGVTVYSGSNPNNGNVWSGTATCPNGGLVYSWSPAAGLSNASIANPVATVSSTTEYCVTVYQQGHPDCPATDCVTITVDDPVDAGSNGSVTTCANGSSFSLFSELAGTPDAGGTWTGPTGATHDAVFVPGSDPSGTYTYTVTGTGACGNSTSTSTVTVIINTPPSPGTDGALTLCSSGAAETLFAALGGNPGTGGSWTGPSAVTGGMIAPATMQAGDYIYTVSGIAPCPDESAMVSVTINTPPDPGADGALTLCSSGASEDLYNALGGSPDPGGVWSGPSDIIGVQIDPATMSAGDYVYTVNGIAPCPTETATVSVAIHTPPNAGNDGSIILCSTSSATSLFDQLGGTPDADGSWSGPSGVSGGMIDPAAMLAGVYTYTVSGTAPCPDATATVSVTINTPPDPGTDGALTLCSSGVAEGLFTALGGSPDGGGIWTGPSTVTGGMIDPATMSAGDYVYTVNGTAPCPTETATVSVAINTPPNAGNDGSIILCSTSSATSLFDQLGGTPDAGGTWSGPSVVTGGVIDPAAMLAGVYTYTVSGTAPCPDATATVSVTINTPPDPGTDGALTLCSSGVAEGLFTALGGSPDGGGIWTGPSTVTGGMIDPATMSAGDYVYTVNGIAPCPAESTTVSVAIHTPPNAGNDGSIILCSTSSATSLFDQLGGTPDAGGIWSGPSVVTGGMIDPAAMLAGDYTYTVSGTAPCPDATATVSVTINTPPDPGNDGALTLCSSGLPQGLFTALGGSPDGGGAWTGPSTVTGGMIDPATMGAGDYVYTVNGTAPCPTETATVSVAIHTPPNAGNDGSIILCSTSSATSLFDQLGGTPDAGGIWSGPSVVTGGMIDPATMLAGDYVYTVSGIPPCPNETATVSVTINLQPNAGTDGSIALCISSPGIPLFAELNGTPNAGGTWSGPSAVNNGLFDPASMVPGDYTYTVTGTAPCPTVSALVTVNVVTNPDPGTPGSLTLCASAASINLFAQLGGTPDTGGAWTGPSTVTGGLFDPATMSAGVYSYTITVPPPCSSVSSTVTLNVVQPPSAGNSSALTLCISSPATNLFTALGGSPDAGGTWSGPSTIAGGSFDPATMNAGNYTYTVAGTTPCPADQAVVSVSVVAAPDAGTPGSITLCSSDDPIALFAQLGGTPDAGGAWSGPSTVTGGQFDPASMSAGVYTYTISVPPPCVNASSAVTVSVQAPPTAGTDASLTLCISSPATNLFNTLGGTPDTGGTWSGPSTLTGGSFDPATMNAGDYTYTVAGTTPCPADQAVVSVSVVAAPDAGTPGSITLCSSDDPIALFAQLGGTPDAGGAWSGPSTVTGGQFDPASMSAGVYTYTISVPPPCVNATSTVTVSVQTPPSAGSDAPLTLCISSPATNLFNSLGGNPNVGGTWSGPSTITAGSFDPATMNAGDYTYTVGGTTPCPADQAVVSVSVVAAPDAGTPGSITLCSSDDPIALFTQLGGTPDAGGAWSGPSTVTGGQFDPASMSAGLYTYTISVPPPCVNATSTVTVSVQAPPNAGSDGSLTLCISSPASDLFAFLGGSPHTGGSWTGPSTITGGSFNPSTMAAGDYTYTVAGTTPCPTDQAVVSVSVVAAPDAGTPGSITLCSSDDPIALFAQLGGTPDAGGAWSGPSTVTGGQFDPASMNAGVYTYTISVPPPCVNATSTVTVSVQAPPNAGSDASLTLCISSPVSDLFNTLGGSPDAGGTWSGPSALTAGSFDPATMNAGDYTYTVAGTTPCPADQAVVSVSVLAAPDAGTPGSITLCSTDDVIELFAQLGGTPDAGGAWSGPSAVTGGQFDPASMSAGEYTYTISVPPPCVNATSTVTVSVQAPPSAGGDGSLTLCISSPANDLFNSLSGSPDAGGTWSGPSALTAGSFDPATMNAGEYTYTVAGTTPCPAEQATVSVTVSSEPNPGDDDILNLCGSGDPVELFPALGGADAGGNWAGPSGTAFNGTFLPGTSSAGNYTYLIPGVAPCPSVSAVITVNVVTDAFAGGDGSLSICTSGNITSLFSRLQGTPDTGGDWLAPNGTPFSGTFNPLSDPGGVYTYVIAVPQPCVNDTAEVLVNVTPAVNAGNDTSLTLCSTSAVINLFDHLGVADEGGSWIGPDGPSSSAYYPSSGIAGNFTYTVLGTAPCPNVSATVSISLNTMPDAGLDGNASVCPEAPPVNLFATLGGTPDLGGSWTAPNGLPHGNIFNPATDPQGAYTYTVNGAAPCPDDNASATVQIYLVPVPNAGPDEVSCSYDHALNATGSWISGAWSGPAGTSITNTDSASTTASVAAGGAYAFIWRTRSAEGCTSSDTVTIVFSDPIIPTVNVTDALCNGSCDGAANATATGGNVISDGYQYQWSAPGGATPWSIGYCAGNYTVTVLDTNGCWATTNFTIQEPVPLEIDLITATDELCPGSCDGTILVTDPEGAHYSLNNGGTLQEEELFTGLCAGAYTVTMLDDNGCTASSMAFIGSPAPVRAGFSVHPDSLFINDPVAAFTNTSSANATHFLWDFGDGTTSAEISPTHSFPMGMAADHEICLTAMTDNGCPDIYCVPLPVLELPGIFVPNAFTPDGDGRNDVFQISGTGLSPTGFHLMIFDRWGEKVFDTTDLHASWDGTLKGSVVKQDVYVWKVVAYPLYSLVPYEMMGHVTVVR